MQDNDEIKDGTGHHTEVSVHVNAKPVELKHHQVAGVAIKKAAIAQGVEIELDFVLLEELDHDHRTREIGDDEVITVTHKSQFQAIAKDVVIHVNTKPVELKSHRVTGLAIKQAAIAQGVRIQLDFVLLEELDHHRTRQIGDAEPVTVTHKSQFQAIPNDDHS